MEIPEHQRRGIEEGIGAIAVTLAEMGHAEEDARQQIVGYLVERLRVDDANPVPVIREAAVAIQSFPSGATCHAIDLVVARRAGRQGMRS